MIKSWIRNTVNFLLAVATTLALTMDMSLEWMNASDSSLRLMKLIKSLDAINLTSFILIILFFVLYKNLFFVQKLERKWCVFIPAMMFAFFMVVGYSFHMTSTFQLVAKNFCQAIKSIVAFVGYTALFYMCIHYFFKFIRSSKSEANTSCKIYAFIFDKKPFLIPWGIIIIAWLPWIIASYPLNISYDLIAQIHEFFGNIPISNHHPIFSTVIIGCFVKLGKLVGSDNAAFFSYTVVQVILFSSVLTLTLLYMKKLNTPYYVRIFALFLYATASSFVYFSAYLVKDVQYAIFILAFTMFLHMFLSKPLSRLQFAGFLSTAILAVLSRNNGIYTVFPALLVLLLVKNTNKKQLLLAIGSVFFIYIAIHRILFPVLGIPESKKAEMLSIPFQQTARYATRYSDETSRAEKDIIDKVLDYETIKKSYNPRLSDPVKGTARANASETDFRAYINVWAAQFARHPFVYIAATVDNTFEYFYSYRVQPDRYGDTFTKEQDVLTVFNMDEDKKIIYTHKPDVCKKAESLVNGKLMPACRNIPFNAIFATVFFYTWMLILSVFMLIQVRAYRYLAAALPSVLTLMICVASPLCGELRYALPYVVCVPFLMSICFSVKNGRKSIAKSS